MRFFFKICLLGWLLGTSAPVAYSQRVNYYTLPPLTDVAKVPWHQSTYRFPEFQKGKITYTKGFELDHEHLPEFASVSLGELKILLSGPGASGSRPMKDGRTQEPGGWNRVVLRVKNLEEWFATLQKQNVSFRNEMETGPTGRQIQLEDPDGNAIELFEPAEHPPTKP